MEGVCVRVSIEAGRDKGANQQGTRDEEGL